MVQAKSMLVGVKMCGHCNPHIDMPSVLIKLNKQAQNIEFIRWDDEGGYDTLIMLNACEVGCATHPDFQGPLLVVAGLTINSQVVSEDKLVDTILDNLNQGKDFMNISKKLFGGAK